MNTSLLSIIFLILGTLLSPATPLNSTATYAIGDLHGDVTCAYHWVGRTGLVDNLLSKDPTQWSWNDPTSSLVFLGDYVDKGPTSRQTVEFVKSLTERFPDYVTAIMGNHELELLKDRDELDNGDKGNYYHQYAHGVVMPGEYLNFMEDLQDTDREVVDALYDAILETYSAGLHNTYSVSPSRSSWADGSVTEFILSPTLRQIAKQKLRTYQRNYMEAFRTGTELGDWLERRPVAHISSDGTIFVHGGINNIAANFLRDGEKSVQKLNKDLAGQSKEGRLSKFLRRTIQGQVAEGLVHYRGNHEKRGCGELEKYLLIMTGVNRLAVGHTPYDDVQILCDDTFLALDSSLSRWFRANGNDYCQGDRKQYSLDGEYWCEKKNEFCEGEIVRILDGKIELISSLPERTEL